MSITEPIYKEEVVMKQMPMFNVTDAEMGKNIGRTISFKNPKCIIQQRPAVIKSIQNTYYNKLAYRVYAEGDEFGSPAFPEMIEFVD